MKLKNVFYTLLPKISSHTYNYLDKSKEDLLKELGQPERCSDNTILFYNRKSFFFRDEILFLLKGEKVVEIGITHYFMGLGISDVIYRKSGIPTYSNVNLISHKVRQY